MRNPYDAIGRIGLLLAIVGAVNWLLVGLLEWNLVHGLFTDSGTQTVNSVGERVVYIVVGGVLAMPMLAASLAHARSRGTEHAERESSDRYVETDDTAYYLGAPKNSAKKAANRGRCASPRASRSVRRRAPRCAGPSESSSAPRSR